jgi:hypothetical protein
MPHPNTDELNEAVSRALQAGDFETARRLSVDLGSAIRLELAAARPAQRVLLFKQRIGSFQEHLSLARVLRAHVSSQLQTNAAACLYQPEQGGNHCWRFDA